MVRKLSMTFAMAVFVCSACAAASAPLTVTSPDGNLAVYFEVKANPQPYLPGDRAYYRVSYKGTPILRDSPLGLDFLGAPPLDHGFEILGSTPSSHKDTWENPLGTKRVVPDHYNQLSISLQERDLPHRRLDVIFRAFNEGIAFRYFLPRQQGLEKFTLSAENTGFYFARQAFAYASTSSRTINAYETQFKRVNVSIHFICIYPRPYIVCERLERAVRPEAWEHRACFRLEFSDPL